MISSARDSIMDSTASIVSGVGAVTVGLPVRPEVAKKSTALRLVEPPPERLGVVADRCHDLAPVHVLLGGGPYLISESTQETARGVWPCVDRCWATEVWWWLGEIR